MCLKITQTTINFFINLEEITPYINVRTPYNNIKNQGVSAESLIRDIQRLHMILNSYVPSFSELKTLAELGVSEKIYTSIFDFFTSTIDEMNEHIRSELKTNYIL